MITCDIIFVFTCFVSLNILTELNFNDGSRNVPSLLVSERESHGDKDRQANRHRERGRETDRQSYRQ